MEKDIVFGTTEKENKREYDSFTAGLKLNAGNNGATAAVLFTLRRGWEIPPVDMERREESFLLTIKQAKELADKLELFIAEGERFVSDYKD